MVYKVSSAIVVKLFHFWKRLSPLLSYFTQLVNGLLRSRCGNLAIMSLSKQTINEKSQINLKGFEGFIYLGPNT